MVITFQAKEVIHKGKTLLVCNLIGKHKKAIVLTLGDGNGQLRFQIPGYNDSLLHTHTMCYSNK